MGVLLKQAHKGQIYFLCSNDNAPTFDACFSVWIQAFFPLPVWDNFTVTGNMSTIDLNINVMKNDISVTQVKTISKIQGWKKYWFDLL